ncbi:MAG: PAS domain S-box protein [Pseudomonadota bacterium]
MIAQFQPSLSEPPTAERRRVDANAPEALTAADRQRLLIERHALLRRNAALSIAVGVVLALAAIVVGWSTIARPVLLAWSAGVLALAAARAFTLHAAAKATSDGIVRFGQFHTAAMALNGVAWAALAVIFAAHGQAGHIFLPIAIAGLTSGALAASVASWRPVVAFNGPALAGLALTYAFSGASPHGWLYAGLVLLYGGVTAWLAYGAQTTTERLIRMRLRQQNLVKALDRRSEMTRESESRFRAIVESSREVTMIFSLEGRVLYASPAVETLLASTPQDVIGKSTKRLIHPDDFGVFKAAGERALADLGAVIPINHLCLKRGDGAYAPLTGRLTNMLYVPGVEGFVFTAAPVEERVTAYAHAAE